MEIYLDLNCIINYTLLKLKRKLLIMPSSTVSPNYNKQTESVSKSRLSKSQNNIYKLENEDTTQTSNSFNNENNFNKNDSIINKSNDKNENMDFSKKTQLFFRRWIILLIFCLITLLSAFNWIQYSIIQDVVIEFYNESLPIESADKYDAVNWLSMVYMLAYIPLVFPTMFLLDRKGLRVSIILGALVNCVGAVIKCFALRSDLFLVAMLGQTFCAIAQSFTLGIPARLSALWFGQNEVSTATSVS